MKGVHLGRASRRKERAAGRGARGRVGGEGEGTVRRGKNAALTAEAGPKEILGVLYNRRGSFLYGCILFFKYRPGGQPVKPHEQSAVFTVAETLGPDEVVVHGSVDYLLLDIRRLLRSVHEQIDENNAALSHLAPTQGAQGERAVLHQVPDGDQERRTYFEFTRRLAGTLILISTQARNLFQLFPRLDREIGLFDHNGSQTGGISLVNLFNHFVHNQYLFLDGEHVSDLFPANPRPGAPISRTFMGYRFNWIEYVQSIESAMREVKLRDLTGLLRGRLKKLSLASRYSDIVFLVQNLYSFSRLFATMPAGGQRYGSMLDLLLAEQSKAHLDSLKRTHGVGDRVSLTVAYKAPSIAIHEDLSEKKFRVRLRCKWWLHDSNGRPIYEDEDFSDLAIEVGYEQLLDRVNQVFGDDPLLDFRP